MRPINHEKSKASEGFLSNTGWLIWSVESNLTQVITFSLRKMKFLRLMNQLEGQNLISSCNYRRYRLKMVPRKWTFRFLLADQLVKGEPDGFRFELTGRRWLKRSFEKISRRDHWKSLPVSFLLFLLFFFFKYFWRW